METKDKYDLAVEYLTANPKEILEAWRFSDALGRQHQYHYLFRYITPNALVSHPIDCGCLVIIRACGQKAYGSNKKVDEALTQAIMNDDRIPTQYQSISPAHLPVFAEWQRRIDKYYETGILEREASPAEKEGHNVPQTVPQELEYRTVVIDSKVKQLTEEKIFQS